MLIEMIPPEYWPQIWAELNNLGDFHKLAGDTARRRADERSARMIAEYDAAIRKKQLEEKRTYNNNRKMR